MNFYLLLLLYLFISRDNRGFIIALGVIYSCSIFNIYIKNEYRITINSPIIIKLLGLPPGLISLKRL